MQLADNSEIIDTRDKKFTETKRPGIGYLTAKADRFNLQKHNQRQAKQQRAKEILKQQRAELIQEAAQKPPESSAFVEPDNPAPAMEAQKIKQHNRENYLKRIESKRQENIKKHTRAYNLAKYNKKHKCSHGLAFNVIRFVGDKYVFSCDHGQPSEYVPDVQFPCHACGFFLEVVKRRKCCGCVFALCPRCKRCTYRIENNDRIIFQNYEPHVNANIHLTCGDWDEDIIDFEARLKQVQQKTVVDAKETSGYAAVVKKKRFTTRQTRKQFYQELKAALAEAKRPQEVVETVPEGGAVSSIMSPVTATFKTVQDKTNEVRKKVRDFIRPMLRTIKDKFGKYVLTAKITGGIEAMWYVIKCALDYIGNINPLTLYDIYKAIRAGEWANVSVRMIALLIDVKRAEELSLSTFENYIRQHEAQGYTLATSKRHISEGTSPSFGALHTQLKWVVDNSTDVNNYEALITKSRTLGLFSTLHTSSMVYESGAESFLATICGVFDAIPRRFREFLPILKSTAKDILPLMTMTKISVDLSKTLFNLISSFLNKLFGRITDSKVWLAQESSREGSPIAEAVSNYIAYNMSLNDEAPAMDSEKLRSQFFNSLPKCDTHAKDCGHLGPWLDFRRKLVEGFNTPPRPTPRDFEPTLLVLSGIPGVGKSTIWRTIVGPTLVSPNEEGIIDLKAFEKLVHTWNPSSEFQPGMSRAKVVLFDDFQQNRASNIEALNLIHLLTNAPYPINSPNITGPEVKGCFAKPEVVVICTNQTVQNAAQGLADADALHRRYDLEIEIQRRYDPRRPGDKIGLVKSCNRYSALIGKTLDLQEIRTIFEVVHRIKRERFEETTKLIATEMVCPLMPIKIPLSNVEVEEKAKTWQLGENFVADYTRVMAKIKEDRAIAQAAVKCNIATRRSADQPCTSQMQRPVDEISKANSKRTPEYSADQAIDPDDFQDTVETKAEGGYSWDYYLHMATQCLKTGLSMAIPVRIAATFIEMIESLSLLPEVGLCTLLAVWSRKMVSALITCGIALGLAVAGAKVFGYFSSSVKEESGTTKTAKNKTPVNSVVESGEHHDFEVLSDIFRKATGWIRRSDATLVNCVFVGGNYILLPRHFFLNLNTTEFIEAGMLLTVSKSNWNGNQISFEYNPKDLVPIRGHSPAGPTDDNYRSDVVLYNLPRKLFSAEKSITKFFWDGVGDLTNQQVCKIDYIPQASESKFVESVGRVSHMSKYTHRYEQKQQISHILAQADYASRSCSCGSLVRRGGQEAPLLGIHVAAGTNKYAYFHFVTRKALEDAMKGNVVDVEMGPNLPVITHAESDVVFQPENSTLQLEYELQRPIFQPNRTDLTHSLCFEALGPHTTEPAVLSSRDHRLDEKYQGVEFYRELFAKFQRRPGAFKPRDIEWAVETMRDDIQRLIKKSTVKSAVLDLPEAINGLNIPDNTAMDMSTSMGWPYSGPKSDYFDVYEPGAGSRIIVPKQRISQDFAAAVETLKRGNVPFLPFVYMLKDERVKLKKIAKPGTRLFANGNVINYLLCRRYFYTFLMQLYHADMSDSWSFPSLDRLSLDWHRLISHLAEVGDRGFDFDFGGWDRRTQHLLMYECVDLMLEGQAITAHERVAIKEMIASPFVIFGKKVYRVNGSIMSGVLVTFALNCLINEVIHRAAYYHLALVNAPTYARISVYKANVRGIRGGDDTLTVVSDDVLSWYNGKTVADYFEERGLEVTASDKSDVIPESSDLMTLSFLKNKTRKMLGYYVPLPDFQSLVESCYWVRINKWNPDVLKATQDNCEASLLGIYFYGKPTYDKVRNALLEKEPRLQLSTYTELNRIWSKFFYFPGAHADYASPSLQAVSYKVDAQPKFRDARLTYEIENNMQDFTYESGKTPSATDNSRAVDKVADADNTQRDFAAMSMGTPGQATEKVANVDLGSVEKTETHKFGSAVQDSAQTSVKTILTGQTPIRPQSVRSQAYLNDRPWKLTSFLEKFTYLRDANWTIAQPTGHVLASLAIPGDILRTAAQKAPFDLTKFARFNSVTIKVVVKSSPFYSGTLVQGFTPLNATPDYRRQINMGASIMKLSQDEGVEFKIPFRYYKGALVLPDDKIGTYTLTVQCPLRTGAANANNIGVSIYVAVDGMEFKVPDIIPSTRYASNKLDKSYVVTYLESGVDEQKTTICNVNDPVQEIASTSLCAGEGCITSVKVGHFQDAPIDLVTLMKRWRVCNRTRISIPANNEAAASIKVADLERIALGPLSYLFAAKRGSIMFRARIISVESSSSSGLVFVHPGHGRMSLALNNASLNYALNHHNMRYDGVHHFDAQSPACICIPYAKNTFILPVESENDEKSVYVELFGVNSGPTTYVVEFEVCLGDDYHVGFFTGADNNLVDNLSKLPISWSKKAITFDSVVTIPESGILDFVDRAIETTVPIVQAASELGVLSDAHPITSQPYPVQIRRQPYGVACDLVNYKETLLTTNHNGMSLPDKECFGVATHEANIENLLTNTKSQVGILNWASSDTTGTLLASLAVGPALENGPGQLHDKLAQFFYYWNGGVKFIVDVSASQQHRGQLLFSYAIGNEVPSYNDATQGYFTTFDLSQGRGTIAIDTPYLSNIPYKRVRTVNDSSPNEPFAPGFLHIFVQNPLRSTDAVANNVDIVIYKSYNKDFKLDVFGNLGSLPPPS